MAAFQYNIEELKKLMKNFHILTGMLFSLYDDQCNPVTNYPSTDNHFCQMIRRSPREQQNAGVPIWLLLKLPENPENV